ECGAEPGDLAQRRVDLREDLAAARRIEVGDLAHLAGPAGVPVDRLAVLVELRLCQQVGGAVAQPPADRPAQLRRPVVQRLPAYAERAHAGAGRRDQRALAGHVAARLTGRLWRRDGYTGKIGRAH